jgi:hypothetical protein
LKIKLKTSFAGSIYGTIGDIVEVDDADAKRLLELNLAEIVEDVKEESKEEKSTKKKK